MFNFFKGATEERNLSQTSGGFLRLFDTKTTPTREALSLPVLYRSVQVITSSIACTELNTKNQTIQNIINKPNNLQTTYDLLASVTQDLIMQGNGYILPDYTGPKLDALYHIPSKDVELIVTQDKANPYYYMVTYFGQNYKLFPDDLIHFRNPLTTHASVGYSGISPLQLHSLTFDQQRDEYAYLHDYYTKGVQINGVVETAERLQPQVVEDLRVMFKKKFSGRGSNAETPILTAGLKYKQLNQVTPTDAAYVQSRNLSDLDISRIFGVPKSILGIGEQKYSNAAQERLVFSNYTLNPVMTSIQETLSKRLFCDILFKADPLEYSESSEKAQTLSLLVNSMLFTPNEARAHYGLEPIPGGDEMQIKETQEDVHYDTNKSKTDQKPKTTSTVTSKSAYNNSRSLDDIDKEIQTLKSERGRMATASPCKSNITSPNTDVKE